MIDKVTVHSTLQKPVTLGSPCQNMVDKLGLNFGSSATSARTSRDFTTPTLIALGVNSTALHDAALGEDAMAARTMGTTTRAQQPLRLNAMALDAPRRLQDDTRDRRGLDASASGLHSSRTFGQHASAYTAGSGSHRHASPAALFNGGCGGERTRNSNLAGDLAGSGGLLGATTEEGIRTEPAVGTHKTAYNSSNNNNHGVGVGGDSNGGDHLRQQPAQPVPAPTAVEPAPASVEPVPAT